MDYVELVRLLIESLQTPQMVFLAIVFLVFVLVVVGVPLFIINRLLKMIDKVFEHTGILRNLTSILSGRINVDKINGKDN